MYVLRLSNTFRFQVSCVRFQADWSSGFIFVITDYFNNVEADALKSVPLNITSRSALATNAF